MRASSLHGSTTYGRSRKSTWLHARGRLRLPDSPLIMIGVIFGALVFGYLLFTRASLDFRIYLIWAFAVSALALALVIKYASTRRAFWLVVAIGLMAKLFGSVARYEIIFRAYEGSSDAPGYFDRGLTIARDLWQLDLNSLLASGGESIWGTEFLSKITGIVVAVSGPSMRAAFLLYSLLAFAGVLLFASAYGRVPGSKPVTYLAWLVLWPSIFFWPSSIGKEAFLLFGLGAAVWGFAHFPRVAAWPALAFGLLAVGMVRPHVAGVAMLAMCAGALMASGSRGLIGRWYFQSVFWIGALALTVYLSTSALGIESTEEAVDMVERQAGLSALGGSATEAAGLSWTQIPQALANTLFRPYVWEASSALLAISAAEILVLIALVIWRRRALWVSLRGWRTHRLIGFCIVFIILYGLMLGYSMSNVGIIARQRVLLLPMLLLLLQQRDSEPEGM